MKTIHHLLTTYTIIVLLFVILFAFVIYTSNPGPREVFSMVLSMVMFSLIPFGIIFLLWKHNRH